MSVFFSIIIPYVSETMKKPAGTVFSRGPMGEFASDKPDKPFLTSLARPMPGPSNYSPSKAKTGAGEWSIVGKPKNLPVSAGPPPTRYRTDGDLAWKNKTISLKQQGNTCPLGPRHDGHITASKGPNAYNVKYGNVGHLSQKFSIGARTDVTAILHTRGRDVPGPSYMAPDDRAKSFSLGMPIPISSETAGPGPAGYEPPDSIRGVNAPLPAKVDNELASSTDITLPRFFGWNVGYTPFRKINVEDSPGPMYDIGTTMGDGQAKSVAWRQNFHITKEGKVPAWPASNRRAPAPGSYNPRFSDKPSIPKQTMAHQTIAPTDPGEPGPNKYKTEKDEFSNTAFSFGGKGKPTYPVILNYVEHSIAADIPAPHKFCGPSNFSKNSAPKSGISLPLKAPLNTNPGPNRYRPELTKRQGPQYSISSKIEKSDDNGNPGPGSYNTMRTKPETPLFKLTGRPKVRKAEATPGPNAYNIAKSAAKPKGKGATLKGRPSPFVYSGFKDTSKVSTLVS